MTLSEEQRQDAKEAFNLFDNDADGLIPVKDISIIMQSLCNDPINAELNKIIEDMDQKSTGMVDFDNFLRVYEKSGETNKEAVLINALKAFDKNNKGYIDRNELKQVMLNLGEKLNEEEVAKFIQDGDTKGDGNVNIKKFAKILLNN